MDVFDYYQQAIDLLTNPANNGRVTALLLGADAALTTLIIRKVPYTEIDFSTYMRQISLYLDGERDYTKIKGPTGPLVYPAGHVYIYSGLYWLTDGGKDIFLAQCAFGALYIACLAMVIVVYRKCQTPPYLLPLLILSKRLHSIFVLRLFNDCFAVAALFTAIYAYQNRQWMLGSVIISLGVAVKMSLLLALPGVAMVLGQALPSSKALANLGVMLQVQLLLALPFLFSNAQGYASRAFEFSRQFLFKWSVNWRFVGEEIFLSRGFSVFLLATHLSLLVLFVLTRWIRPSSLSITQFVRRVFQPLPQHIERSISLRVTPVFVMTCILGSMSIGMLCARSLHYQFFAYIAWASPFLLWRAELHPVLIYAIWAAQEWAWNVYPSSKGSSMIVVACLVVQVLGVWWGTRDESSDIPKPPADEGAKMHSD